MDVIENLRSLVEGSLGEYQALAASLPDVWTILVIPATLGLLYCFFGCKRWMRRLLGGFLGLALCSMLTFALAPRLFDFSPTALLVLTVAAGLLGALVFSFGNIILEFLAYFLVFRLALHLLTSLGGTACSIIAAVLAWVVCIAFIKDRMVPTVVAGASLCGLASMYFNNIYLSGGVFLVLLVLGILTQRALIKASKAKVGATEEDVEAASAGDPAEGAGATGVLEVRPDLTGLPIITEEDAATLELPAMEDETAIQELPAMEEETATQELPAVEEEAVPAVEEEAAIQVMDEAEGLEDGLEDGFIILERNVTLDDLWSGEEPVRTWAAAAPSRSSRKAAVKKGKDGETRGTLVAATALATTVLTIISLGLVKTFKRS